MTRHLLFQLKAMGIDDICGFGFMDAPKPERVRYSLDRLKDLGALNSRLTFLFVIFPS
jgi:HrpA-like RNA helicase